MRWRRTSICSRKVLINCSRSCSISCRSKELPWSWTSAVMQSVEEKKTTLYWCKPLSQIIEKISKRNVSSPHCMVVLVLPPQLNWIYAWQLVGTIVSSFPAGLFLPWILRMSGRLRCGSCCSILRCNRWISLRNSAMILVYWAMWYETLSRLRFTCPDRETERAWDEC